MQRQLQPSKPRVPGPNPGGRTTTYTGFPVRVWPDCGHPYRAPGQARLVRTPAGWDIVHPIPVTPAAGPSDLGPDGILSWDADFATLEDRAAADAVAALALCLASSSLALFGWLGVASCALLLPASALALMSAVIAGGVE